MQSTKVIFQELPYHFWTAVSKRWRISLLIIIATVCVIALINFVAWAPAVDFFTWDYWREGGVNTSRSEVLRNVGLVAAGVIGVGFGVWRSITASQQTKTGQRQAITDEQGHFTDRFNKAVELLGRPEETIRVGGIYALWRLSEDSPNRDQRPVWDILSFYLRYPPRAEYSDVEDEETVHNITARGDIQIILNLFGNRRAAGSRRDALYILDLSQSNLDKQSMSGAELSDTNLSRAEMFGANLSDADLSGTNLFDANLSNANLSRANLSNADLLGARLTKANLSDTNLSNAVLSGANLSRANLINANLSGAELTNAKLPDAKLVNANLYAVNLYAANLTSANLSGANLINAVLPIADLSGANLYNANLSNTDLSTVKNLTQEQLDSAISKTEYPPKGLPTNLVWNREGTATSV